MNNSLSVLADSLDVKLDLMDRIFACTNSQKDLLEMGLQDFVEFDRMVDEKDVLVDKLISLDDGFEQLYSDIATQLKDNREKYSAQIRNLQDKIRRITELSASIQAQETRNKKMMDDYFSKERQGIKQNRVNSKAAYDYYKSMSGMNIQTPGIWDSKN